MALQELSFNRTGVTDQFPVTLEAAKDHLRVDFNDDDARITQLIHSVCAEAQHFIGKPVYETLWKSGKIKIDPESRISLPYIQSAVVTTAADGAIVPSVLHVTDAQAKITLDNAFADDIYVSLAQQYTSEDLELTLLLTLAFYYERRDLSRFSEQTLATLRKRLIYHRDAIVASSNAT